MDTNKTKSDGLYRRRQTNLGGVASSNPFNTLQKYKRSKGFASLGPFVDLLCTFSFIFAGHFVNVLNNRENIYSPIII